MDDRPKPDIGDQVDVFEELTRAQMLYEPYRQLAEVAKLAALHRQPESAQPSWDHPLGLVIRSSK